jgi:hypothetical protein
MLQIVRGMFWDLRSSGRGNINFSWMEVFSRIGSAADGTSSLNTTTCFSSASLS